MGIIFHTESNRAQQGYPWFGGKKEESFIRGWEQIIKNKCEVCHKEYKSRFDVHSQLNNSEKGYRMICCTCLGHKQLECMKP